MKLLYLLPLLSSTLLAKSTAPDNAPFVIVQNLHAPSEPLACDGSASHKTTVVVSVDLEGGAPAEARVKLSVYLVSLDPYKKTWVLIDDVAKYTTVKPGITKVPFTIRCGSELQDGSVTLGSLVLESPQPIELPQSISDMRTRAVLQVRTKKSLGKPKGENQAADDNKVEQEKKENNKK